MKRFIIAGGVAAGATAAARLRRLDEEAQIILVEKGSNISYANCGLPYYIGAEIENRKNLFVATKKSMERKYNIDVREYSEVIEIDPKLKTAAIVDRKTGEKNIEEYTALLLATGSAPVVPPIPGVDGSNVFTVWTVSDSDRIKDFITRNKAKTSVIVGGGFIGLEMAENLKNLGMNVHIAEMLPHVMNPLDPDMSKLVENHLRDKGVSLHLGNGISSIEDNGRVAVLSDGSRIECDFIIMSAGIKPNNEIAKKLNLNMDNRGLVVTDECMRTNIDGIYAAGDLVTIKDIVTGEKHGVPLAGPANKEGRIAADNMYFDSMENEVHKREKIRLSKMKDADKRYRYTGSQGTSIARIFDLSVASTGINEKQLKAAGKEYMKDYACSLVKPMSHAGYYPGAEQMIIKLLFSLENGKILGAQIIGGEGVDKRIDVIATALRLGADVYELTQLELAYAPPYSSAKDPVNIAGYAATNILDGLSDALTWEIALNETEDKDNVLLDVREDFETTAFGVEKAKHIPLPQLRSRLGELDKEKTYYITCAVGLRGYIAERIMKQSGFRVKNILGGMSTYRELIK